ncbi:hypothetical protein pb186bvf_019252 [Paramecium bursaria]
MSVKTKYRLQDVLTGNLKNEEKSAQKVVQMNHIQKNQANFENLGKTLKERKITFSQFSFQQSEMIDDRKLRPVLNGICGRLGSMSCAELLTKKQIQFYLKSAEMSNQKRILKRYAHWEWDQTEEKKELPKYNFAGKVESDFKQQVKAKDAERRLRKQILKKWADQLPDVSGLATFGKQFTMQSTPIAKSKFFLTSYVNKSSLVKGFIDELTDIHEDLKQDKKILKTTLSKLKYIIQKRESANKTA